MTPAPAVSRDQSAGPRNGVPSAPVAHCSAYCTGFRALSRVIQHPAGQPDQVCASQGRAARVLPRAPDSTVLEQTQLFWSCCVFRQRLPGCRSSGPGGSQLKALGEMARARPSSSCKAMLPSLWTPETTPSRHRAPSRRRNRTRSPAESPSLARAALVSCPSRRRPLELEPPRPGVRPSARIDASAAPRLSPQQRPAETDPQDRRRGSGDEPLG